ncbi:RNA polymerase sigma factor [Porphyromonas endodontalis]|jgi:RNA polymerase sigma factor, sigma-70 family|uniref:Sigma-70 region 2 n=1 Tax=Porphyromonas endodontalis (strain ATCC 35406 / DSM 24491 / JCM 8526 / CCUG 16442 / BCRC 14492 / NCTC 13058 / HG 370) TaxID=553175 RepID=C3J9B8_POREA|nr:RNA polymerase sigma factor [Porphyromonas endodontalis]EEN83195.1 Sigma-70 region 2 [Porphyromonas endodontalis ATCC 35406]UBH64554.1 RNA polymerase sigma factor [Porphyromonas endodontalis]SUB76633.1 Sigma-24 [Porphyromonas endodontalis]
MTRTQFQSNLQEVQENLRRYALKLTQDTNDADDLVQDTSLRALTHRDKFVSDINFKGWMMTIMYNIFLNNQDRVERRRKIFDTTVDILNVPLVTEGGYSTPDGAMNIREIYSAIDNLSEHTRTPFKMFLSGYKYSEIAEKIGIPEGTVKSRIFFARKALQKSLRDMR